MTWQEFLDLTSAVGTSRHPPCLVLPRWVIFIGDDKQGLPLGDVLGRGWGAETCGCKSQRISTIIRTRGWGEGGKGSSEQPASSRGKTSCLHHLPLGRELGSASSFSPSLKFSVSALQSCCSLAESWLSCL